MRGVPRLSRQGAFDRSRSVGMPKSMITKPKLSCVSGEHLGLQAEARLRAKAGGGGSRTRVRRHFPAGLYMHSRFFFLAPGVRKRLKTARRQPRCFSRSDAEAPSDRQPA